jgi:hypothetical protein
MRGGLCGGGTGFLTDFASGSDKSVSRETFLSDWSRKPYKTAYIRRLEIGGIAPEIGIFGGSCPRRERAPAASPTTEI